MITIGNLTKSFGRLVLFEGVTFTVAPRERVGLIGRNGDGKTTLLRLIAGEEEPEQGTISVPRNYRIGYVRQNVEFTEETVLGEGMRGLQSEESDHHWKVEKVLAGLGFSQEDMQQRPKELSGGYQVRLSLAKVLVSQPDLLLLDEPTNYLDITSIRWIEHFLVSWPGEMIVVTHDRAFMDKVATHIVAIHRKKTRKIQGDTTKMYDQIAQDEEVYEKTRINDQRRRKEIELFVSRFRAKARLAGLVQSRLKTLQKQKKQGALEKIKTLDFAFRSKPFAGKYVMSLQDVSFSYGPEKPLIHDLNVTIRPKDRLCVVGKNGRGKTTLLNLLAGVLSPQQGEITRHPAVAEGFFEQTNVSRLVESRTVEEEVLLSNPDVGRQMARNICGAMMFEGDAALKRIGVLSGGEKSRVMLGQLLVKPVNLLLLDEPTNHLDIYACDALLAAIDSFDGAVVMVTHNEMFLHALAERLIVFQEQGPFVFEGTYQDFMEKGGWNDEPRRAESSRQNGRGEKKQGRPNRPEKKEIKRQKFEIISERSRLQKPIEKRIAKTEEEIDLLEKKLETLGQAMTTASQEGNATDIAEISQSIRECHNAIETLFKELETLTHTYEKQNVMFEERLARLEGSLAS